MPRLTADDAPISPYRVIHEMNNVFDRANTVVTHDAGNPRDQILPFYETAWSRCTVISRVVSITGLSTPERASSQSNSS